MSADDDAYRELLLEPIRKCAGYLPKMGGQDDVNLDAFRSTYASDPLYHWVGLDSPLMFAAHKAAGGMTSVYRQLGIGCERMFRQILRDGFGLDTKQVQWAYEVADVSDDEAEEPHEGRRKRPRRLTLDGRVDIADVSDRSAAGRILDWIEGQKKALNITADLKGAVFEVRQGYKSADSKRQNGDLSNSAQAYSHGYMPSIIIMSTQVNHAVRQRYEIGKLPVLTGILGLEDPLKSTFDFCDQVVGYDLPAFFERNTDSIRSEVEGILANLLEAK